MVVAELLSMIKIILTALCVLIVIVASIRAIGEEYRRNQREAADSVGNIFTKIPDMVKGAYMSIKQIEQEETEKMFKSSKESEFKL